MARIPFLSRRGVAIGGAAVAVVAGLAARRLARPREAPPVAPGVVDTAARRPNILFILSDQERHWTDLPSGLGLAAHEMLLEQGVGYLNYNIHTTPCSPSRSTLYFGQHTQHTGMTVNHGAPPFPEIRRSMPSMGHLMRAQGYYTAYKGKWHLSHMTGDFNLGYGPFPNTSAALEPFGFADYNIDGDPHGATWTGFRFDAQIAADAALWLADKGKTLADEGKPWMLAVNFVNPHDVMYFSSGAAQVRSRKDPNLLAPIAPPPVGGVYDKAWDLPMPESYYKADIARRNWSQQSYADFCDMIYGRMDPADEAMFRRYQSYYFNCIRDVDRNAMTVLKQLAALGLDRNTIVVYGSDHGEMAGAQRLRQKGPHMFKENVRVPLIVRHPDVRGGFTTAALASPVDVIPTLLSWAGVERPRREELYPYLKGIDIAATAASPSARTERDRIGILYDYGVSHYWDPVFTEKAIEKQSPIDKLFLIRNALATGMFFPSLNNPGLFRGVFDGRYKFARYFRPSQHHTPEDFETLKRLNQLELYDTLADPNELTNLALDAERHQEVIMRLNAMTNALVAREVGVDDGREHTGPTNWYRLNKLFGTPA